MFTLGYKERSFQVIESKHVHKVYISLWTLNDIEALQEIVLVKTLLDEWLIACINCSFSFNEVANQSCICILVVQILVSI